MGSTGTLIFISPKMTTFEAQWLRLLAGGVGNSRHIAGVMRQRGRSFDLKLRNPIYQGW